MTNNLNPADWVCLPRDATDEMQEAIGEAVDCQYDEINILHAAQRAAPPHNLIPVDKGELERLQKELGRQRRLVKLWGIISYLYFDGGEQANKLGDRLVKGVLVDGLETFHEDNICANFEKAKTAVITKPALEATNV